MRGISSFWMLHAGTWPQANFPKHWNFDWSYARLLKVVYSLSAPSLFWLLGCAGLVGFVSFRHWHCNVYIDYFLSLCEGGIPCFEMAVVNADKPPLSYGEVKRRVKQFQDRGVSNVHPNFQGAVILFADTGLLKRVFYLLMISSEPWSHHSFIFTLFTEDSRGMRFTCALEIPSSAGKTIVVTNQPFFYKKAEILPASSFVVGVDTAIRLINVRSPWQHFLTPPLEQWSF